MAKKSKVIMWLDVGWLTELEYANDLSVKKIVYTWNISLFLTR